MFARFKIRRAEFKLTTFYFFNYSRREHHEGRELRHDAEEVEVVDWSGALPRHREYFTCSSTRSHQSQKRAVFFPTSTDKKDRRN